MWTFSLKRERENKRNNLFVQFSMFHPITDIIYSTEFPTIVLLLNRKKSVIPAQHRILWVNSVDLVWNAILASQAQSKDSVLEETDDVEEQVMLQEYVNISAFDELEEEEENTSATTITSIRTVS